MTVAQCSVGFYSQVEADGDQAAAPRSLPLTVEFEAAASRRPFKGLWRVPSYAACAEIAPYSWEHLESLPVGCRPRSGSIKGVVRKQPLASWVASSTPGSLLADAVAGATVAVMAVPQAVSFAAMAGVPAAYGLYTAFVPVLIYCCTGSSRHLALGPVALVSLLLNDGLTKAIPGSDINDNPNQPKDPALQAAFNHAAIQVSAMVAILYLFMGTLRLGFLLDLLSKPIISGFLTAGAMIISTSQVKYLLGYNIPHVERFQDMLWYLISRRHNFWWPELAFGLLWVVILVGVKNAPRVHRRLQWMAPLGPITVAVVSISLVWARSLDQTLGMSIVGPIEAGLPPLTVGVLLPLGANWPRLVATAILIGAVSILEAISIAKALAEQNGDRVSADRELFAMGFSNLAGAAFCSYPATGSFARSAVQSTSGARTGLAGLANALLIGLVLVCLTPVAQFLPMNALAAIVIVGVVPIIDFGYLFYLARVSRSDCVVWLATFFGCLLVSIDVGLALGVVLGVLILFKQVAFPDMARLGRIPGSTMYRHAGMYKLQHDGDEDGQLAIVRIQGPVCFANVNRIDKYLTQVKDDLHSKGVIVIDASSINFVDSSGLKLLSRLLSAWQHQLLFSDPNQAMLKILDRGKLLGELGPNILFASVHDAVLHCQTADLQPLPRGHRALSNRSLQNGHAHIDQHDDHDGINVQSRTQPPLTVKLLEDFV